MASYYMFYKPRGYLTACRDAHRATIMPLLPAALQHLHPVGRLDRDTEGLLLLTDDGRLDNRLLQPRAHVEKAYFFAAFGALEEDAQAALQTGLLLPGDPSPTAPAVLSGVQRRPLSECQAWLPVGYKRRVLRLPQRQIVTGTLTIREGRKHQVRRMLGACGCQIFYLKRTAIGGVTLDATLAPGQLRPLTGAERILLGVAADREEPL